MGERERIIHEYLWSFLTAERKARLHEVLDWRTRHLTVVLENVYQPHNTSAVLRSCDAFGVQDVNIVEADNRFRVTRQITMGTDKWLTLHRHQAGANPATACIDHLRKKGYRILVTAPASTASPPADIDISQKSALVIGHETDGVSACFAAAADEWVAIPMYGFVESFNLSVAAALCLYELTDRLHRSDIDWRLTPEEREALCIEWTRKSVPHLDAIEQRFWSERPTE